MAVFIPLQIQVENQQTIKLIFSSPPSPLITRDNFAISSTFTGVAALEILSISISDITITITTRPQFPSNLYIINLNDTSTQIFEDINHIELQYTNNARQVYFVGVEDINVIRDTMLQNLPSNYDTSEQTLVRDVISTIADELNQASIALQEIKNDNFISIEVKDELYFRGPGPSDRLKNEGVYEIIRVANTVTGTNAAGQKNFDPIIDPNLPFEIINLRVMQVTEIVPNGISANNFDGFLITVNNAYVTKLLSVVLDPGSVFYDPSKYGYALLNNNYDRFARPSSILANNQILLSALTHGNFPEPIPGDELTVIYEFDHIGRRVDGSSIELFSVVEQKNEVVPASVSNFYLIFANIVNSIGQDIVLSGVRFSISSINLKTHAAFLREIVFNIDTLPGAPGEYAINYITGQVFVFGTQMQIGTGPIPPVASYFYKNIAVPNTDYFISDDGYNISLNHMSLFAANQFVITYLYEDVFTPGINYEVTSHNEILNERVNNKLISDFGIRVNNGPVKDVYQILNETTGESYTPGLIEGDKIYFTGNIPPVTSNSLGELAEAGFVDDEMLNVGMETTTPNGLTRIFPIALEQHFILSQRQDGIGSNFSSSIQFTRNDLFVNEYFFNPFKTVPRNIAKLQNAGDYTIDYLNGNIYIAVSSLQNFDVGHISYAYGVFIPAHKHVLGVSSIGLGTTSANLIQSFDLNEVQDGLIVPKTLNYCYDVFDGITKVPNSNIIYVCQLQDDFTLYTNHPIKRVYGVYTQNDIDAYGTSTISSKNLWNVSVNSFTNTKIDLKTYIVLPAALVNPMYYEVIIPEVTTIVKSIVTVDTSIELLDMDLYVITYSNIIIKTVVQGIGFATVTLQNIITLNTPLLDSLVDIAGHRFDITNITSGDILTVNITGSTYPVANVGSQILDHNGILIADHLNVISVTELPDLLYILHYDVFPSGVLPGYQVKDYNGNIFVITDVQTSSVVVEVSNNIVPVTDPIARIETQSLLIAGPGLNETTLRLPIDTPIGVGTNLRIGYVPESINQSIIAATTLTSAGGVGMIVDYSIGQYFINYTHLDDELVVSYEWGDNQINWSISDTLTNGDPYYISYKYGASRNGLETNFAPLTNVDFLQNAPLSVSRETYRTAVGSAIKAFLKGPTHEAIRLLAHAFTQIDPDIQESGLNQWLIGRDPLLLQQPKTTGNVIFGNGKYNEGLIINDGDSIQLPGASSIRLTQGTFSTWFRPNWNGNQADSDITFNLPSALYSVYYNASNLLPQNAPNYPWYLSIDADAYGTAVAHLDYVEVSNSKNMFDGAYPSNVAYIENDGYDVSSTLMLHEPFNDFAYSINIGHYTWKRYEEILSAANDIDINFAAHVFELKYVNPILDLIKVANVVIDDAHSKYDMGFYLTRRNTYSLSVILEDVHLSIEPPYPHYSPPITVSTSAGSNIVNVIDGDTSTLSVGQQVTIGDAYPELTNIIGFTASTIILRFDALETIADINIGNLDPISNIGTLDGYGEIHLEDKIGMRPLNSIVDRTDGWDRQLLVKLELTPETSGHLMDLGSNEQPLTTQTPVIDFLDSIMPGGDVFVDGYGNVFEIDHVNLPYVWLKKPSASDMSIPDGNITAFRKVAGISFPDTTFTSTPINWSIPHTACLLQKRDGLLTLFVNESQISGSYVLRQTNNTDGIAGISFGSIDFNVDSIIRIHSINYNIYSILNAKDIYVGNTGAHPNADSVDFGYSIQTTGIPAISVDKYFAIFTSKTNAAADEPPDQVFVKTKIPSTWTLNDGTNTVDLTITPTIKFSTNINGDLINIEDSYGMNYTKSLNNIITLSAIDTSSYVPGQANILFHMGPELRIAAGRRHYLLDVSTDEGSLGLYRNGSGYLTAETRLDNSIEFNISSDVSNWQAGQLHHVAMSWKISSPDQTDELHLFIDGDEVPNQVSFGSNMIDGYFGQIYEEQLIPIMRIASSGGFIVNDINGSGVFIPTSAITQPDDTWLDKTIVLNAAMLGPNIYLDDPLIVGAIVSVAGGTMLFLSQNNTQLDFSIYGPSTPILYGLATSAIADTTILVNTNFGVFKNGVELDGPFTDNQQFRHVGDSQAIELYDINADTGQYIENVTDMDTITIRTYGLLIQRIKQNIYQYGSLIRSEPIILDILQDSIIVPINVTVNNGGPAFITDLQPPVDPTKIQVTKILLPKTMI